MSCDTFCWELALLEHELRIWRIGHLNRISIGDERLHLCARRSARLIIHVLKDMWIVESALVSHEWWDQSSQATGP